MWDLPERARFVGVLLDAIGEVGAMPPADLPPGPPFFRYADPSALIELFDTAGFGAVEVSTVAFDQQISSADELWHGLLDGTVRTSALVLAQPEPTQARIRAAFDRRVAGYASSIRVSAVIASGSSA